MIVTVTANPSIDRPMRLDGALRRGEVQTASPGADEPGGKGANVAKALTAAGVDAVAAVVADADDPYLALLRATGVRTAASPAEAPVRVNLTITEPDGTTTKLNAPGAATPAALERLRANVADRLSSAIDGDHLVVLSGSLPSAAPDDWYAEWLPALAAAGARVAVDTSGPALAAVLDAAVGGVEVAIVKPNGAELSAALRDTGIDADAPSGEAIEADPAVAVAAVARLLAARPGIDAVLLTLGGAGAILVTADGAWHAAAPPTVVVSTVGAGDSALAGWIIAASAGGDHAARLASAVAYGSAAAALPGSTPPTPDQADPARVVVTRLPMAAAPPERH